MNRISKYVGLLVLASGFAFGQATTPSTTFSTTVAYSDKTVNVTSATGILGLQQGAFQTILYADKEAIGVISVSGTALTVQRGIDGTKQSGHSTTAVVWNGPPGYFSLNSDPSGTCATTDVPAFPRFFELTGNGYTCPTAGPNKSQWTLQYPATSTVLPGDSSLTGTVGLSVCHAQYSFAVDGGATGLITPKNNCTIPINAIVYQGIVEIGATTVGSTGNVSVGLSAGAGGAAALLAATARASLTTGLMFQSPPVPTTASASNTSYFKMSAAGTVTVTVATNPLTAGILDVYVWYVVPTV